jgi:methylmalonyl-CoA decarboxylase
MNMLTEITKPTSKELLDVRVEHAVATITLMHPAKRNALSHRLLQSLVDACQACARQRIRVMILKAQLQAGVWSSGHDIGELPRDGSDPLAPRSALETAIETLRRSPFPVIAQIQGSVWGGALELVASCDIVVVDESARFAITPARIGLPYNLPGLRHLAERMPYGAIKKMFFTAQPVDAEQALRTGLADDLAPAGTIDQRVQALAQGMAGNAALAIFAVKEQLRQLSDAQNVPADVVERLAALRRRAYQGRDYREGLHAFEQKRLPQFTEYAAMPVEGYMPV